jgi:ankyrin repeat protein
MHLQGSANQETMIAELAGLRSQIGRVEVAIQSREALQTSTGDLLKDNGRIIHNLQQYVRVAESFYSNASNIAESVNGGSVIGDPLSQDQWSFIEQWIPQPQILEEPNEEDIIRHRLSSSPSTSPSTEMGLATAEDRTVLTTLSSATTVPQLGQSDSESDIENEATRKFQELALQKFEQKDYIKAEALLRKAIDRNRLREDDSQARDDSLAMKVKLAIACSFQEKWQEVEAFILPLAEMKGLTDVEVFHAMHALALAIKERGDFTLAVKYTKQALNGKRRILGKTHDSYFESIALLAYIYDAKGDLDDAEVYKNFLPAEHRYDLIRAPQLGALQYLTKSILGSKIEQLEVPTGRKPTQLEMQSPSTSILQNSMPHASDLSFKDIAKDTLPLPQHAPTPRKLAPRVATLVAGVLRYNKSLLEAVRKGDGATVQKLLEKGADANFKDSIGWTPLSCAADKGDEAIIQLLLEKGADIEAKDNDGRTALRIAASKGHKAVLQLLLEKGAQIEAKDNIGRTALRIAASKGHKALVQLLLVKGANIEVKDKDGGTALHWAASNWHEAIVQLLLEKGADIEARDKDGRTALRIAASKGHKAVLQLLLEKGAQIEATDNVGRTALRVAASKGYKAMVQLLLEKGADVEAKDKEDKTALHWAAFNGHEAIVQLLLEKGADVQAEDNNGWTALDLAASINNKTMVRLLTPLTRIDRSHPIYLSPR